MTKSSYVAQGNEYCCEYCGKHLSRRKYDKYPIVPVSTNPYSGGIYWGRACSDYCKEKQESEYEFNK